MILDGPEVLGDQVKRSWIMNLHCFQQHFLPELREIAMIGSCVERRIFLDFRFVGKLGDWNGGIEVESFEDIALNF